MKKMVLLRYITFSILLILTAYSFSFGQDENLYAPKKEKEPLKLMGIKLGVNIGRFADFQFKPERFSYEGSADINLNNKYFGLIEGGYSKIDLTKNNYHYLSEGTFIKLGFEYNMLKKQPTDFLGIAIKIGKSDFSQQAKNVLIETSQWGTYETNIAPTDYSMYWLEASLGIKGEIFNNVYLGWSALVKARISGGEDRNLQPYDIPGFGNGSKSINLGINYYIYYQIPFNRSK
jgi:hypothetical protein